VVAVFHTATRLLCSLHLKKAAGRFPHRSGFQNLHAASSSIFSFFRNVGDHVAQDVRARPTPGYPASPHGLHINRMTVSIGKKLVQRRPAQHESDRRAVGGDGFAKTAFLTGPPITGTRSFDVIMVDLRDDQSTSFAILRALELEITAQTGFGKLGSSSRPNGCVERATIDGGRARSAFR